MKKHDNMKRFAANYDKCWQGVCSPSSSCSAGVKRARQRSDRGRFSFLLMRRVFEVRAASVPLSAVSPVLIRRCDVADAKGRQPSVEIDFTLVSVGILNLGKIFQYFDIMLTCA